MKAHQLAALTYIQGSYKRFAELTPPQKAAARLQYRIHLEHHCVFAGVHPDAVSMVPSVDCWFFPLHDIVSADFFDHNPNVQIFDERSAHEQTTHAQ